jgi:hypothetical protein
MPVLGYHGDSRTDQAASEREGFPGRFDSLLSDNNSVLLRRPKRLPTTITMTGWEVFRSDECAEPGQCTSQERL